MKRGCCYAFFVLLVLAGIYSWNLFVSVPLKISPETTLYTEPLTSDGRGVDYFAVMETFYPDEMKTEKNSAREILRRLGPGPELRNVLYLSPEEYSADYEYFYTSLGLEPVSPTEKPEVAFTEVKTAFETWLKTQFPDAKEDDATLWERKARFAQTDDYFALEPEFIREWVTQNSPALDVVAEAVTDAEFLALPRVKVKNHPETLSLSLDFTMAFLKEYRQIARGFWIRAQVRVADGDIDGAIADQMTCFKLGRQIQNGACNVLEFQLGVGIEEYGRQFELATNPDAQPTAEYWERMAEIISQNSRKEEALKHVFECDRILYLSMIQDFARQPRLDIWEGYYDFPFSAWLSCDWNHVMTRILELYEKCVLQNQPKLLDEISQKFYTHDIWQVFRLLKRSGRSELLALALLNLVVPASEMVWHDSESATCKNHLQKLGIAMQKYRLEHDGLLPPAFSVDTEGKPLHSWRVLILPYLGGEKCDELYAKIRLDEPWDSEWNRQFHAEMPEVFRCPQGDPTSCDTNYAVIVGENQLFDGTGTGRDYVQMMRENPTRKVAKMSLIIDRPEFVPWMRPDMEQTPEKYTLPSTYENPYRELHNEMFLTVSCTGATNEIPENYDGGSLEEILPFITGEKSMPNQEGDAR
ncbi:MAG: DUF1559 domain-containing protein [Planctomycetia bacterium]|nr:DUF1559 domain-containing protein [Planctomycetia bacterium]